MFVKPLITYKAKLLVTYMVELPVTYMVKLLVTYMVELAKEGVEASVGGEEGRVTVAKMPFPHLGTRL